MATKFSMSRDALLDALQLVVGVVERRQTLPILSHVLFVLGENQVQLVATDLELELSATAGLLQPMPKQIQLTVPGRKLLDICRNLPEETAMDFSCQKDKLSIKATHAHGSSRFDLAMLPARDFPRIDAAQSEDEQIMLPQSLLKRLLVSTQFAMAQQDVRHYLNGILMEVKAGSLRTVATDGHRLAMATVAYDHAVADKQIIIPRKGVAELARYLSDTPEEVGITINEHFLTIKGPSFALTSKLIDHRFPDYQRALPKGGDKTIQVERELLKSCLSRAAILSNEKFRGISLHFAKDEVSVKANNPEQEVAEEKVQLDYAGPDFSIGFNVNYLLDVVNTLTTELVQFTFGDASSSVEVRGVSHDVDALYVVMPLRL